MGVYVIMSKKKAINILILLTIITLLIYNIYQYRIIKRMKTDIGSTLKYVQLYLGDSGYYIKNYLNEGNITNEGIELLKGLVTVNENVAKFHNMVEIERGFGLIGTSASTYLYGKINEEKLKERLKEHLKYLEDNFYNYTDEEFYYNLYYKNGLKYR